MWMGVGGSRGGQAHGGPEVRCCRTLAVSRGNLDVEHLHSVFLFRLPVCLLHIRFVRFRSFPARQAGNKKACTLGGDSSGGRSRRKRNDKCGLPAARDGEGSASSRPSKHGGRQREHRQPHGSYRQQDGHGGVGGGSRGNGGGKPPDRTCYVCSAPDHLAAQCPRLDGYSPEARADAVRAARRGAPLPPRT